MSTQYSRANQTRVKQKLCPRLDTAAANMCDVAYGENTKTPQIWTDGTIRKTC